MSIPNHAGDSVAGEYISCLVKIGNLRNVPLKVLIFFQAVVLLAQKGI